MRSVDAIYLFGKHLLLYIGAILILLPAGLLAQDSYGLEFASKDIDPDARTGVNMFPEKPFSADNNFSLAFDLSFIPDAGSYFGYVFRLTDEKEQHIDLVYNVRTSSFDLIAGNEYSGVSLKTPPESFSNGWHHIRLDVNSAQRSFTLLMDGRIVSRAGIRFHPGHQWKLYFGANRYERSRTFDLPPMRLKDVKLYRDRELTHHWSLRRYAGNTDTDLINGQVARIDHPLWLAHIYRNWRQAVDFTTMGNASVAFDQDSGVLYVCARDSLFRYNCNKNLLRAEKLQHPQGLPAGNQSVFGGQQLYNFLTDVKMAVVYDKQQHTWKGNIDKDSVTKYWHANRFYAPFDSAIYIIGGYGNYRFSNQVQRYTPAKQRWEMLRAGGDAYTPRYLAALGTTANGDSAYILGGYGSINGDQLLNPHNLYDLTLFDAKAGTFRKIYQLPEPGQPFAFGNSMVIDTKTQHYYALTFANDRMQSSIQLIKGSLQQPTYTKLADAIPFRYFDIRTRVELFYHAKSEKLIAVVLYTPENHITQVRVYTILFPPASLEVAAPPPLSGYPLLWLIAAATIICGAYLFYPERHSVSAPAATGTTMTNHALPPATVTISREADPYFTAAQLKPSILLFGQFTVLDKEGNNVSKLFSPLVKELFLLLLLHSLPGKKGITSEKINETLWPGRSGKDAKNNRSVNIVKLKNVLDRVAPYSLEKDGDRWFLRFEDAHVDIDLLTYYQLVVAADPALIPQIARLTSRGGLLAETEYSWLDKFKSDLTADITTLFLQYLQERAERTSPALVIAIANSMLNFDPLCEEAIVFKCRALVALRQHASAKAIYNSFAREYEAIYGETFEKEYHALLVD
jgi:DNA-binding SARP family transcriptional activator